MLGASFDSVDANRKFAEKENFAFQLLCDTDRDLGVAYHAAPDATASSAKRISYLIDAEGRIAKAYAKVSPAQHPAEVLADIAALQ